MFFDIIIGIICITIVTFIVKWYKSKSQTDPLSVHELTANFLIVNKGPDIAINSNDITRKTVQTILKKTYPYLASDSLYHEFYFAHRLDFATSGLMCIPLNKNACREASKAFQNRSASKFYVAIIKGVVATEFVNVTDPIGPMEHLLHKMCVSPQGKRARTVILVLDYGLFNNYPCTKVLMRPVTGRRHQLRVHCSHLGHTIVGDYTYTNSKDSQTRRMYLHSLRLIIPSEDRVDFSCEDPFVPEKVKEWKVVKSVNNLDADCYNKLNSFV